MPVMGLKWNNRECCYESCETLSGAEARAMIAAERQKNGHLPTARVNKALSKSVALDILERSIADTTDDGPVHHVIAHNIARECGEEWRICCTEIGRAWCGPGAGKEG